MRRDIKALEQLRDAAAQGTLLPDAVSSVPSRSRAPSLLLALQELVDKEAQLLSVKQTDTDQYKPVRDLEIA